MVLIWNKKLISRSFSKSGIVVVSFSSEELNALSFKTVTSLLQPMKYSYNGLANSYQLSIIMDINTTQWWHSPAHCLKASDKLDRSRCKGSKIYLYTSFSGYPFHAFTRKFIKPQIFINSYPFLLECPETPYGCPCPEKTKSRTEFTVVYCKHVNWKQQVQIYNMII